MTVFGLKWGQDLENQAAHPCQEFPGVPPGDFINQKGHTIGEKSVQTLSN